MRGGRRTLTEQDRAHWAAYAQSVKRRQGALTPVSPSSPELPVLGPLPSPATTVVTKSAPPPRRPPPALVIGHAPGGVDRASWMRFRGGKLPAQRTLDLHGRTAQLAHAALHDFLFRAAADGLRCVEVITGRGSGEAGGVLRREVPLWLNGPVLRPLVLAAAHPHAANPGSVRLLLRRRR